MKTQWEKQDFAQDFSQRPEIDYEEKYSPVMNIITFRYLIGLVKI